MNKRTTFITKEENRKNSDFLYTLLIIMFAYIYTLLYFTSIQYIIIHHNRPFRLTPLSSDTNITGLTTLTTFSFHPITPTFKLHSYSRTSMTSYAFTLT